jgi:hypothetical protein
MISDLSNFQPAPGSSLGQPLPVTYDESRSTELPALVDKNLERALPGSLIVVPRGTADMAIAQPIHDVREYLETTHGRSGTLRAGISPV